MGTTLNVQLNYSVNKIASHNGLYVKDIIGSIASLNLLQLFLLGILTQKSDGVSH